MIIAKAVAALCMVIMAGALIWGFTSGDFFAEGRIIFSTTWGIVSIIDVYVGLALFSGWIVFRIPHPTAPFFLSFPSAG